jgi:hypothetical protein
MAPDIQIVASMDMYVHHPIYAGLFGARAEKKVVWVFYWYSGGWTFSGRPPLKKPRIRW